MQSSSQIITTIIHIEEQISEITSKNIQYKQESLLLKYTFECKFSACMPVTHCLRYFVTYLASFSMTYLVTSLNLALLNAWQNKIFRQSTFEPR